MSRAPMPDSAMGEQPMPSSFDQDLDFWDEGRWSKLKRKLKEEPLIPLGLGLTCYALYNAAASMRRGDKEATNRYFRARLYAQGFTIVCVCAGALYWQEDRAKRKHYQGLLGEKKATEKRDAWIRELEARDREEEVERRKREARRERRRELERKGAGEGEAARRSEEAAQEQAQQQVQGANSCPLEREQLVGLLRASSILGPAMGRWWGGSRD